MKIKKLRLRDRVLLTLALFGDLAEEMRDPAGIVSASYETLYGFVPKNYKRTNYRMLVSRMVKTNQIEKTVKDGEVYVVLKNKNGVVNNFFPLAKLQEKWDNKLRIVIFDIDEANRKKRNRLREKLVELGFGMWQKSVWATPLGIEDDFHEFLEENGLANFACIFTVSVKEIGNLKVFANRLWQVSSLNNSYLRWIEEVKLANRGTEKSHNLHDRFWEILMRDPRLPAVFLPSDWKGKEAMALYKRFFGA